MRTRPVAGTLLGVVLGLPLFAAAQTDITHLAACQRRISGEGAKFAEKTINSELKCTQATDACVIDCENGLFGPVCGDPPTPPCCNPDDPNNPPNTDFQNCLAGAQATCNIETAKMALWEQQKQDKILAACSPPKVLASSVCSTNTPGFHFATLAAGCQVEIPGWQCNGINDILTCVGGPLERQLVDQISGLLDPRAADALALLPASIRAQFTNVPLSQRVKGALTAAGQYDVWSLPGLDEGDPLMARVETRDDTGTNQAFTQPSLVLLVAVGSDYAIVPGTTIGPQSCDVPNTCAQPCPIFKRTVPFSGTFYLAVTPNTASGCGPAGKYKLIVTTIGGVVPQLVGQDVPITFTPCGP
jgi:hypothetical protein